LTMHDRSTPNSKTIWNFRQSTRVLACPHLWREAHLLANAVDKNLLRCGGLVLARRDGRHFDGQRSLSGHCGHGPIFIAQRPVANDPGCVKTRTSAKCRKYNSTIRYSAESARDVWLHDAQFFRNASTSTERSGVFTRPRPICDIGPAQFSMRGTSLQG